MRLSVPCTFLFIFFSMAGSFIYIHAGHKKKDLKKSSFSGFLHFYPGRFLFSLFFYPLDRPGKCRNARSAQRMVEGVPTEGLCGSRSDWTSSTATAAALLRTHLPSLFSFSYKSGLIDDHRFAVTHSVSPDFHKKIEKRRVTVPSCQPDHE